MAKQRQSSNEQKLIGLLGYLDAWDGGLKGFRNWYNGTFGKMLKEFDLKRDVSREQLREVAENLEFGKDGRVRSDTVSSRKRIKTFRNRTDNILGRLIVRARKGFGMEGSIDKDTGTYSGRLSKPLKKAARRELNRVNDRVEAQIVRSRVAEINALAPSFKAFIEDAEELLGDHGRKLAENIGLNLTQSIRPTRNRLEESPRQRKNRAQISDDTNMDLQPGHGRNIEFSFKVHLRGIVREAADRFAKQMGARKFIAVGPNRDRPFKVKTGTKHIDEVSDLII